MYLVTALGEVYPTAAERQARAVLMTNPAAVLMGGPAFGLDGYTIGAMVANEGTLTMLVATAIMSILLVVRHTRAEEETGRAELVRAAAVGRRAGLAAATGGPGSGALIALTAAAAGLFAAGLVGIRRRDTSAG